MGIIDSIWGGKSWFLKYWFGMRWEEGEGFISEFSIVFNIHVEREDIRNLRVFLVEARFTEFFEILPLQ